MTCSVVATICLDIGSRKPYGFDLTRSCTRFWKEGEVRAVPETIRPLMEDDGGKGPTGFEYRCTTAGQSGNKEPLWPTTIGATVQDGSVVWTCQAISNDSLFRTITQSVWAGPSEVMFEESAIGSTIGEQKTGVYFNVSAAFSSQLLTNTITLDDGSADGVTVKFAFKASAK